MQPMYDLIRDLETEKRRVEEVISRERFHSNELRGECHGESVALSWAISRAKRILKHYDEAHT
jgi:hypothetical protein